MGFPRNLTGRKFGRLKIIKIVGRNKDRRIVWLCICDCGKYINASSHELLSGDTKSCGCLKKERACEHMRRVGKAGTGIKNNRWKGGRIKKGAGYIAILAREHPFATATGYVLEHRLVMERMLGRYLRPEEVVHHKDGNKKNNDITNLVLFKNSNDHLEHHRRIMEGAARAR